MTAVDVAEAGVEDTPPTGSRSVATAVRLFGWIMLAVLAGFILNVYLNFWQDFPGIEPVFAGSDVGALPFVQLALYALFIFVAVAYVLRDKTVTLRADSRHISDINAYFIRAMFFAVLLVGCIDAVISFVRVEGFLPAIVGDDMAAALGRSSWRGAYVHMPLVGVSLVIAYFVRTLGFIWLALMVVVAELLIVIGRFIFSYEQAFMSDLVRFWYAALFLFASAYTLLEEGHVRVDVFYAGLADRTKGFLNASGTLVFGIPLCWVILIIGAGSKQSIIVSPMISYEVTQAGFGLYVKYMMAGFLAVFAISMLIQFLSYLLTAVADMRGDPGGRQHVVGAAH